MDISVIIPVYGTEKYLRRCMDSVIRQNVENIDIEIIIINDASQDNSLEIVKEYMKKDKRIILIDKKENEGLSSARNSGIEIAKGKYIFHLDSDDWIEENCLQELYNLTEGDVDIIVSDFYIDYGNSKRKYVKVKQHKIVDNISYIKNICYMKIDPYIWGKLIKKDLYIKNNIFHIDGVNIGEDLAVILRLLFFSTRIVKVNQPLYHYFQNIQSLTKKKPSLKKLEDIVNVLEMNKFFFKKYSPMLLSEIDNLYFNHLSRHLLSIKLKNNQFYEEQLNNLLKLIKKVKFKELSKIGKVCFIFRTRKSFYFLRRIYFFYLSLRK